MKTTLNITTNIQISSKTNVLIKFIRMLISNIQQKISTNMPDVIQEQQISPEIEQQAPLQSSIQIQSTKLSLINCIFISISQSIIECMTKQDERMFLNELLSQYENILLTNNVVTQYSLMYLLRSLILTFLSNQTFTLDGNPIWQNVNSVVQEYFLDLQLPRDKQNDSNEEFSNVKYEAYKYICRKLTKYSTYQKANSVKQLIISNIASLSTGFRTFKNVSITSKNISEEKWIKHFLQNSEIYTTVCAKKFNVLSNTQFAIKYPIDDEASKDGQKSFIYSNRDANQKIYSNIQTIILEAMFLSKLNVQFENPEIITSVSLNLCQFPEQSLQRCCNLKNIALSDIDCVKAGVLGNLVKLNKFYAKKIEISNLKYNEAVCDKLFKTLTNCKMLEHIYLYECSMSSTYTINVPYPELKTLQIIGKESYKTLILNVNDGFFRKLELLSVYACINIYSDMNVFKLGFEGEQLPKRLLFIDCANMDEIQPLIDHTYDNL